MIDEFWKRNFGETQPEAHRLRDCCRERWVRFHSLPDSQRYAQTAADWATLLERHNVLVERLATGAGPLQLLTSIWSADQNQVAAPSEFLELGLPAQIWRSFHAEDDPTYWRYIFSTEIKWKTGVLDPTFRLVADNEIVNVMLFDPADDWLIHPYDGGIDLILRTPDQRDKIAVEFGSWRSKRADGL